jgi:hypothetical protein
VLDGHYLARGRVVCVEHVIEQASYVRDFASGKGRGKLRQGVGGFVNECVDGKFGVLVFHGANLKVVVFDFGIDGLERRDQVGLSYVAGGPGARGIWSAPLGFDVVCKAWHGSAEAYCEQSLRVLGRT